LSNIIRTATATRTYAASTAAIIHTRTTTRTAAKTRAATAKRATATTRTYTHDPNLDLYVPPPLTTQPSPAALPPAPTPPLT
jgi:hypothetical protein